MHIIAILLFPVRLVFVPLIIPVTGVMYGLISQNPNNQDTYWSLLWPITKAWLLWHA